MPIVAIANQKGGVGKTTTCVHLAAGMAERTHAATPRFSWNLHTPPAWTASIESLAAERLPPGWRKK